MKYTVLFAREGVTRLERDISFGRERAMREAGYRVLDMWMHQPSLTAVCRAIAHVIQ